METSPQITSTDIILKVKEIAKDICSDTSFQIIEKAIKYSFSCNNANKNSEFEHLLNKSVELAEILLVETGAEGASVGAAILYKTVSREFVDYTAIEENIGKTTSDILKGLHKIPNLRSEKFASQAENFIQLLLTVTGDVRAIVVRLADQIARMRNIESLPDDEQQITAKQTSDLFAPLAHRLGLYKIKTELEETAMKYTHRDMYKFIAKKLSDTKAARDIYIKNFIEPLAKTLKKEKIKAEVKGRPKSIFSIWKKMKKQEVPFEEVYDLFAIRIIIDTPLSKEKEECWKVYSIITDSYRPNPKRLRDWISAPKKSGYESLHTTVIGAESQWVEVQIRTLRMDEIAERGPAAHWMYKDGDKGESKDWLSQMRAALENGTSDDARDEGAKAALYSDEIFIFTPDGDLKKIRAGHTVLDFAFAVHSRLGETCTGAMANGVIKPLSYEMKNGDTIQILTSKNKKPKLEWLQIVKSSKSKAKIKKALKSSVYAKSDAGKEIVKQKFQQLKVEFTETNIQKAVVFFEAESPVKMYQKFGEGKLDVLKLKKVFEAKKEEPKQAVAEEDLKELKEYSSTGKKPKGDYLTIDNTFATVDYTLAKCCNPHPGDDIFGFITVSKGTKIHKVSCPNSKDLKNRYAYRVVQTKWKSDTESGPFIADILIAGKDQIGIITSVTKIISDEFKLGLKAISISAMKGGKFGGVAVVEVNDRDQLNTLMSRLRRVQDILSVKEK